MSVTRKFEAPPIISHPSIDQKTTDSVVTELEDFGLEFDPPGIPEVEVAQSTRPETPMDQIRSANAAKKEKIVTHGAIELDFLNERHREVSFNWKSIRHHIVNGLFSFFKIILLSVLESWEKLNSIAGFRTSPISTDTKTRLVSDDLMDWAHISLNASGGLLVVSLLGGYWGYSWFTGALLFFLGYLISRGFAQVIKVLSAIETRLSSSARGSDEHD